MSDQWIGLLSGAMHLVLSFVLALITTYGAFRLFPILTRDIDELGELKRGNLAVSVMLAAMLLSTAVIMKTVTGSALSSLQTYLARGMTLLRLAKLAALVVGYLAMAILLAVITIWFAIRCFLALTRDLNALAAIRDNNVAVAITLGVVIVVMGLFLAGGIDSFMAALVPAEELVKAKVAGG
ncbi:MAG TPA: DUF350 domain-containing protein [Phycisphaerae bacterium]|nr:DUF350 domain-containing protein [Phycisphaerae bacterium]